MDKKGSSKSQVVMTDHTSVWDVYVCLLKIWNNKIRQWIKCSRFVMKRKSFNNWARYRYNIANGRNIWCYWYCNKVDGNGEIIKKYDNIRSYILHHSFWKNKTILIIDILFYSKCYGMLAIWKPCKNICAISPPSGTAEQVVDWGN